MISFQNLRAHTLALILGAWLLLLRLITAAWIPLTETTEARYGEIARKMLETGNWIYLQNTYDSPFWAKPPLYAWLSAASMGLFGVNEFAARLPAILLGIVTIYLCYITMQRHFSQHLAPRIGLITATLAGFFVGMGTVMTDPSLLFCVTLALCSWWNFHTDGEKKWGLLFFAGVGAGLVAKGPLALVLIGMPIVAYLLLNGGWLRAITTLPWRWGSIIGFVLPLSWYVLAESRTPGFIEYFVLGEHVYRFLKPGWAGDLYGNAHIQPHGMVWLYALIGLLPWSLILLGQFLRTPRALIQVMRTHRFLVFLGLWCLSHLCFFSIAANIIWPYFLPMTPAFAMLCVGLIQVSDRMFKRLAIVCTALISCIVIFVSHMMLNQQDEHLKSAKRIIAQWHAQESTHDERLAYFSNRRLFSAEFYTKGRIHWAQDAEQLLRLHRANQIDYILVSTPEYAALPEEIRTSFSKLSGYYPTPLELELLKRH